MERASDMIRKIWVICSEGGGVEGIISSFLREARQDKINQDTVRFFFQRVGMEMVRYTYIHLLEPILTYMYF